MNDVFQAIVSVVGSLSLLCTALAPLFPRGSRIGYALAKVGADLRGHTSPTLKDE